MNKVVVVLTFLLFLSYHARSQQKVTVYFPFNKYYLTHEATARLDSAVKSNRNIDSIKIYAWCDAIGSTLYNDTLAIRRATSVKNFLLAHHIRTSSFKEMKGYGKRMPINDNSNDSLRALNRRAEVLIFARGALHNDNMQVKYQVNKLVKDKDSIRSAIQGSNVDDKIRLSNLNFYGGRHILLPSSRPMLDTLVSVLMTCPTIEIEIQGYVCCVPIGTEGLDIDEGQWKLSQERAQAVYDYLVTRGIDPGRLSYKGFGNHPLVEEITEDDRTTNRRVEIKILKR